MLLSEMIDVYCDNNMRYKYILRKKCSVFIIKEDGVYSYHRDKVNYGRNVAL
jgi:hypothetical protein